jgi:hypothetical protein
VFFCQCCGCYAVPPTQPGDRQSRFLSGKLPKSSPLIGPTAERLGMALRVNPCPLACRSLDMVPLFGRALAITQKILKAPSAGRARAPALGTGKTPSRDAELFTDMLFQMI